MSNRSLGEEEIEQFLFVYAESEDGFDGDDDSIADPDLVPELEVPMEVEGLEEVGGVDIDTIIENIENSSSTSQSSAPSKTLLQPGPSSTPGTLGRSQPRQKLNLRWKKKNLELKEQQLCFTGGEGLSVEFLEVDSPVQFFFKIFPKELFGEIARQTNLYIVQKDTNMPMYLACDEVTEISTVAWKDNKIVTLASSFVGELPKSQVSRYDKKDKRYVTIDRPNVVGEYNRHMGGFDLIDSIMGRYKVKLRSKRWQVHMFYHFLDLAMSNAWLLYKRVRKTKQTNETLLASADFREEIGTVLCKMGAKAYVQRRSMEPDIQAKKRKVQLNSCLRQLCACTSTKSATGQKVWVEKRIRCKLPKCSGKSQTICEMYGVALCSLCNNKQNNCFKAFHTS